MHWIVLWGDEAYFDGGAKESPDEMRFRSPVGFGQTNKPIGCSKKGRDFSLVRSKSLIQLIGSSLNPILGFWLVFRGSLQLKKIS